ncbi:hypothetical protein [Ornithinimicrobium sp. LYQ103]|uniref:hypothetical protein n=1 Tax=Ornithinimicrobium sp. LYQ103 TaxID=3378796 RepID=UPI0038555741
MVLRVLAVVGACIALAACSSSDTPAAVTETVTATVTAERTGTAEAQESAAPSTASTSSADLRALVEEAVADSDLDLTPQLCADWFDRESEILDLMTETILERLGPLRPSDPGEVREVSAEVIADHIDEECGVVGDRGEVTDPSSMAAVAGLDDCYEPWITTDHVGNDFTVTLCATPDDQVVSLYEYDRSEYVGMVQEYTEVTHVTPTWAVAASTHPLLDEVVGKLESASWSPSAAAARTPEPASEDRAEPPAPKSGTEGWDVIDGDYYATVTDCPLDEDGEPVAMVTVNNDSSREADILGIVEVIDTTTDELHGVIFFDAGRVGPGQQVSIEAVGFQGVPNRYSCAAVTVGAMD